VVLIVLNHLLQ
jgi:hypothetical protein